METTATDYSKAIRTQIRQITHNSDFKEEEKMNAFLGLIEMHCRKTPTPANEAAITFTDELIAEREMCWVICFNYSFKAFEDILKNKETEEPSKAIIKLLSERSEAQTEIRKKIKHQQRTEDFPAYIIVSNDDEGSELDRLGM